MLVDFVFLLRNFGSFFLIAAKSIHVLMRQTILVVTPQHHSLARSLNDVERLLANVTFERALIHTSTLHGQYKKSRSE